MSETILSSFSGRHRVPFSLLSVLLLALLLSIPAPPASAQDTNETFEGATSVTVVEVPVQVVDRDGNPIRGLTRDNFEIRDGRDRPDILYFDAYDVSPGSPTAKEEPITSAGRRHFLLLFDLSFAAPSSILRAREAAQGILDDLQPTDLVAVGTVSVTRGPELVLAFTPDRKAAALAIETLGAPQVVDRGAESLGLSIAALGAGASESSLTGQNAGVGKVVGGGVGGGSAEAGGKFEDSVEDYVKGVVDSVNRADREAQVGRIQGMARSMAGLANLMRAVDGRKHVVYLSEGFDSRLLTGGGGLGDGALDEQRRNIETGSVWEVDSAAMFGDSRLQNTLEAMLEEFRRADCSIHSVDIGGLRAPGDAGVANGQDGLVAMARGTGGNIYQNFNDLGEAMNDVLQSTAVTYVLGFQPEGLPRDGSYRKLDVRLKDGPRGARIVHRPGYFAPPPPGQQRSAQQERLKVASQLVAGRVGGPLGVEVLAVPFADPAREQPAVPVLVEIDGSRLAPQGSPRQIPLEIYAYAMTDEGTVGDSFFQNLGLDLDQVGEKLRAGGVRFYGQLDLDPGVYQLRVLVRDPLSGASGLSEVSLEVPSFGGEELAVLPPLIPETDIDSWLMVRQPADPDDPALAYPFVLGEGQSFIPRAVPVIRGAKPVNLGVFAYHLGEGQPVLNAQVVDDEGNVVLGQQLPVYERLPTDAGGPDRLLSALQLPGVPPGDYRLNVTLSEAGNPAGGRRLALGTLPIRVEPGPPGEEVALLGTTTTTTTAEPGTIGADGRIVPEPVIRGRDSKRFPGLKAAYQRTLARLSGGEEQPAQAALVAMEQGERQETDDVRLTVLADAEMEAAHQLAERDPDALIPVMLLHEKAYNVYRELDQPLLALHSRTMVRDLAELYVDRGGSPTSLAASVFQSLGGSLQQAGLTRAANLLFERALDLQKESPGALLSLAVYYEKVGQYDQAVRYLERLVEADPGSAEGWLRLGINLERVEKDRQAAEWLVKASGSAAPDWVRSLAYQQRARTALDAGRLGEADSLLAEAVDQVPGDQHLLLLRAHVLDRRGRGADSQAVLARVEPPAPGADDSPRYRYNRWPIHVLEDGRRELAANAEQRLPVLAGVIRALPESEWSR